MTTEIAILNRSAVALAADSAVTISVGDGNEAQIAKIYANANKLFELVKGAAVGVMIYNTADIGTLPWESVVKAFRSSTFSHRRMTLEEYADDLQRFVADILTRALTEDERLAAVSLHVRAVVGNFLSAMEHTPGKLRKANDRKSVLEKEATRNLKELKQLDVADWASGLDDAQLMRRYRARFLPEVPEVWCGCRLSKRLRSLLVELAMAFLIRSQDLIGPWTGVVVAGFGDDEMFPSLRSVRIAGMFEDRLIWLQPEVAKVGVSVPSLIRPYAQTNDAQAFLLGIDPQVSQAIGRFWRDWAAAIHGDIVQIAVSQFSPPTDEATRFGEAVETYMKESFKEFGQFMQENFHDLRSASITASAAFLSKGEIANLAENLVELTSLRNRVSLDRLETVGGATDVAVISKGDGFVWVKRKHYFERDRNPAWAMRSTLTDVGLVPGKLERGQR